MIVARLSQVAQAVHPRLIRGDAAFTGVSTDTRTVAAGELFVALRGERHDAHEFAEQAKAQGKPLDEIRQAFVDRQPMGRLGAAEEIAWLAVYLASDEASYTTGQIHLIDGGFAL